MFPVLLGGNTMKQYEAVIEVMMERGGYATLSYQMNGYQLKDFFSKSGRGSGH